MKINSIENASAVNVGQNYLADWYNSDKWNQGFGQNYGDESGIIGTKSFVDDSDMIDSPSLKAQCFRKCGHHKSLRRNKSWVTFSLRLQYLIILGFKINVMDRMSTLSFGPVQQIDVYLSTKRNQGFGEKNGDLSPSYLPVSSTFDPDANDSSSAKGNVGF